MNNNIMMKTATLSISSSLSIPDEIVIYEILKRLPVKTLCRFKSVSKRWLSIINSRPFIESHFQHSKLNPTRLFAFHNNKDTTLIFSTNYPHTWPDTHYRVCSISPRGLICFYGTDNDTAAAIQIWNPSTGEHIEVNPPPHYKLGKRRHLLLGFDPVSKKHKLLSFSNNENYVFTLDENKWRKMDNSSSNLTPGVVEEDCCTDGIVCYFGQRDDDDDLVLMRFDVGSETFLEPILLPGDLVRFPDDDDHSYFSSGIYVYRGMILLLNYDNVRGRFQMWVLEKNKWSSKRLIPWQPPSPEYYSVGFTDGEEILVYSSELDVNSEEDFRLCSYDLKKGSSSSWKETTFSELKNKFDEPARYNVGFYYFVNTLEPLLKPLSIDE